MTLEWQVTSPPPIFNFDEPPQVVGGPYEYGVPGARHAIVTVHGPEPQFAGVGTAPAGAAATAVAERPAPRQQALSSMRHILVVANQTVAGDALIAAVRRRAGSEPARVTVLCPRTDEGAWVVDEHQVTRSTRDRLDAMLAILGDAGIDASGVIVDSDPYAAIMDQVESGDPPAEIIISTLPQTRSGWLRRDLIERVRQDAGVPVEHVVVDVAPNPAGPPA
jgi:hypothetical protein